MTLDFIAYKIYPTASSMKLRPSARTRLWIQQTPEHFAARCLPLLIANQAGWMLHNTHTFTATWDGGIAISSLVLSYRDGPGTALSHFGSGILTWNIPYVFRTQDGYNLLARGPANQPKDGISPLEGIVETDWASATFTMNWKMTRPGSVTFEVDEPICMLVPQKRGELEQFSPNYATLSDNGTLLEEYQKWAASRANFNAELNVAGSPASQRQWEKDYFQGKNFPDHQTKLVLKEFTE